MHRAAIPCAAALIAALAAGGGVAARQSNAPGAPQAPAAPIAESPEPQPTRATAALPQVATPQVLAVDKPVAPVKAVIAPEKPAEPAKRARSSVAIIQALDKVTTETLRFEVPIGQPIRYKTLIFTVRACETSAHDEITPETAAYLVVDTQPKAIAGRVAPSGRQIYKGWMYANSPGLNPLQHPVYDAWLIACKASSPVAPVASR